MSAPILVTASFDPDAKVWFTECADLPGLAIEAETIEALLERLPGAILDLVELGGDRVEGDVPFELVARRSAFARLPAAA